MRDGRPLPPALPLARPAVPPGGPPSPYVTRCSSVFHVAVAKWKTAQTRTSGPPQRAGVRRAPAAAAWLVEHHVLASAAATPVLPIPGAGGAGLDWARIIPVVSLLIIAVVWGVWLARNRPTPRGGAK